MNLIALMFNLINYKNVSTVFNKLYIAYFKIHTLSN